MGEMRDDGVRRALAVFTSAYSSYSGCRQYREDLFRAQQAVGRRTRRRCRACACSSTTPASSPRTSIVFAPHSRSSPDGRRHIAFTAHSIPAAMARSCAYEAQLQETARLVAEAVGVEDWAVVYQSRSGSPQVPWLEPGRLGPPRRGGSPRNPERRRCADRVHLGSHRGAVRPRRRGARRRRRARARVRACQDGRHAPRLRLGARRPDRRADDPGAERPRSAASARATTCARRTAASLAAAVRVRGTHRTRIAAVSVRDPLSDEQREIREHVRTLARERSRRAPPRSTRRRSSRGTSSSSSARTSCSACLFDEAVRRHRRRAR